MKNSNAVITLLIANFISGIAQGISMIAVPIYFSTMGISEWFATAYVLITLVTLFWSPFAGTLVDKYNRKNLFMVLTSSMALLLFGIVFVNSKLSTLPPIMAFLPFALTFWNYSLHYGAFYAFMQEISEARYYGRVAGMIEVQSQLGAGLAGACASILLKGADWGWLKIPKLTLNQVFAIDASTYVIALVLIITIRYVPLMQREKDIAPLRHRLAYGFNYLKQNPNLFLFGVLSNMVFVTILVFLFTLSPVYIVQHLGFSNSEEIYAIGEAFYAAGAVIAGLSVQYVFRRYTTVSSIIVLNVIAALIYFILGINGSQYLYFILGFFIGIANAGVRVLRISYLFRVIPNKVIGRANGIFSLSTIVVRILFLSIVALPFFHSDGNVIYGLFMLSFFLLVVILIFGIFYQKFLAKNMEKEIEHAAPDIEKN